MKENREKPKIKSRGKKKKKRRRNEDKKKDDGGEEEKRQKSRWITSAATKRERESAMTQGYTTFQSSIGVVYTLLHGRSSSVGRALRPTQIYINRFPPGQNPQANLAVSMSG